MHPALQLLTGDQLAGRVARVGEQKRGQAAALDLTRQIVGAEGVAALSLQQDRDRRERLEDVEQLFVGGVVRQEVAEVDVAEAGGGAGQRRAAATGDAHVLGGVLRGHALAIQAVVECSDRLAQLVQAADRSILEVIDVHRHAGDTLRRPFERAGLGLALAKVAPVRIGRREAGFAGFGGDVDDAGLRDRSERVEIGFVVHEVRSRRSLRDQGKLRNHCQIGLCQGL